VTKHPETRLPAWPNEPPLCRAPPSTHPKILDFKKPSKAPARDR
jgi:hypothetical protein